MGGYGLPAPTPASAAFQLTDDRLEAQFGDRVTVRCVWNIMDLEDGAEGIWLVEDGLRRSAISRRAT